MSYSKTTWLETSMSTAQKLTGLDNLEGMYGQAVSYIDAVSHSERYYDEGTCDSKYFPKGVKTTNSVAATLDGYTADQIIAAGSPSGVIAFWSGSEASIPSGWILSNGLNGTPDLRNRFVVGAGSHYAKGDTGGSNTVTTTGTVTIAGHTLTAAEIPKHTHGSITDHYSTYTLGYSSEVGTTYYVQLGQSDISRNTGSTGDGGSHTHTASFAGTSSQDKRPPFYALCFIMKS